VGNDLGAEVRVLDTNLENVGKVMTIDFVEVET
jgi:hypothetical protein